MTPLLSVEHLTGGYGRRTVVRDVSFTVERGELCALLGLNGCGKSTLLKSVCGLLPIREGRCAVDGEDCTHLHERQRALRMAYIPQRATPIAGRTVLDVVLMGFNARLHLFETPGRGRRQLAAETLGQLGLADMAELDYAELSEGAEAAGDPGPHAGAGRTGDADGRAGQRPGLRQPQHGAGAHPLHSEKPEPGRADHPARPQFRPGLLRQAAPNEGRRHYRPGGPGGDRPGGDRGCPLLDLRPGAGAPPPGGLCDGAGGGREER